MSHVKNVLQDQVVRLRLVFVGLNETCVSDKYLSLSNHISSLIVSERATINLTKISASEDLSDQMII